MLIWAFLKISALTLIFIYFATLAYCVELDGAFLWQFVGRKLEASFDTRRGQFTTVSRLVVELIQHPVKHVAKE
jgi:predicted membrane protein